MNDVDVYGQNPIYYAVSMGHLEVCKLFRSYGSEIDHVDENGETPIYYAVKANRGPIVEWLIG